MEFGRQSGPFASRWAPDRISFVRMLIVANVVASLLQWGIDLVCSGWSETYFALSSSGIGDDRYWQFVTYMFLHGGNIHQVGLPMAVLHLALNCLGLYFAGREVEIVLGPKHLLGIYFVGGIVGGILQLLMLPPGEYLVGASAGVCAVLLAFTTMLPELEVAGLFFVIPFRTKAKWLGRLVIWFSIFCATLPFFGLAFMGGVGHIAHLGGALTGWFYTRRLGFGGPFWFQRFFRDRRRIRERQERMDSNEFISREIDPILDKIAREGIHSLTRAERRILELGREKIEKKTNPPRFDQ